MGLDETLYKSFGEVYYNYLMQHSKTKPVRVGLFVTCLVDLFRPNVGFSAIKLLEDAGCVVEVPTQQTCCAQPAYNSGNLDDTRAIARSVMEAFADFDYVVAPSGSCAGMLAKHYPGLFVEDPTWHRRAVEFSSRCRELLSFLHDDLGVRDVEARFATRATYHDSCSGLRELGIKEQPRQLLDGVHNLELVEMADTEVCCGFGGTFCVKYPEISTRLVSDKINNIQNAGATTLLGGDLGCLLNIAGRLRRLESSVRVYHVAEVLAERASGPAIAEKSTEKSR